MRGRKRPGKRPGLILRFIWSCSFFDPGPVYNVRGLCIICSHGCFVFNGVPHDVKIAMGFVRIARVHGEVSIFSSVEVVPEQEIKFRFHGHCVQLKNVTHAFHIRTNTCTLATSLKHNLNFGGSIFAGSLDYFDVLIEIIDQH